MSVEGAPMTSGGALCCYSVPGASGCARELWDVSAEQWARIYWGREGGYPSVRDLARRYGVSAHTVKGCLRRAGLRLRSLREQVACDWRQGRRTPGPGRRDGFGGGFDRDPERLRVALERAAAWHSAHRGAADPRYLRVSRPCGWCGQPVTRVRSQLKNARVFCGCACASAWGHHCRYRRGALRPVVVEALVGFGGRRADGTRWDPHERRSALERKGEELEATWEEVVEAIIRLEEEAGQS